MQRRDFLKLSAATALTAALPLQRAHAAELIELPMYYPVAVGGPIAKIMDGYAAAFHRANPDVRIRPIYTGSYQDTTIKALTALRGGGSSAPKMAVALAVDIFTYLDQGVLVAVEELAKGDKAWLNSFYPAFLTNSRANGKIWSAPFQRSTPVLYWNKAAFKAVGLDPERAPADWAEMQDYARRLTRRHNAKSVTEWGIQIPSSGFPYWLFQGLAIENGQARLASVDGTHTYFDTPETIGALEYMVDLGRKSKVMPSGIINWGTTPQDFFQNRCAMMWTTTGNLTNVRKHAPFPFGVGMLPKHKRYGAPTGGGNLYVFNNTTDAERAAALRFIRWVTSPEMAADWSMQTGYIATSPAAWDTDALKQYVAGFPQAVVARNQLQYAEPELSTHQNQRVTKVFNDALEAALTGQKAPAVALHEAQSRANAILRRYRA
ncbi:ABC transporter substrate-binding protein [Acidihalobacter ferrooxydans]|uniref:ABC transporter substrate-binding protein n=1 Tax=Acidihalobacter ferrooxydans TaxID=1765967 RepID=A0A1P8UH02_9GAMM|nr:ABC transporter substrate-binding protein [Acidihalobacter ferrooxydans]APZ43044.1 ABC transporter substrate-binding protein [Acidihalobacter ferrooxydans]